MAGNTMKSAEPTRALLVIDSDESQQRRWREVAEKRGLSCVCAGSLRAATARLSSTSGALTQVWDWILIDERLPDGSGMSLLSLMDRLPKKPTVVVVSGHLDAADCIQLMSRGVPVVLKPLALDQMRELLQQLELRYRGDWPLAQDGLGYRLSRRELEVLQLSIMGLRQREIAKRLGCSEGSVKTLSQRVCNKAGKESLRDVVAHAVSVMARQIPRPAPSSSATYSLPADASVSTAPDSGKALAHRSRHSTKRLRPPARRVRSC
jgi:DNA-binding NarL/FixJ family response regulator